MSAQFAALQLEPDVKADFAVTSALDGLTAAWPAA